MASPTTNDLRPALGAWLLVTICAIGAVLRIWNLTAESIWWDEAATWGQVNGAFLQIFERTAQDNYPPAYNVLAWVSVQLLGNTEIGLRLPAAIVGVLTIPLAYALGKVAGGERAGLIAALMMALSPFAIYYSQEARPYSLLAAASALHLLLLFRAIERPSGATYGALTLSAVLLLYTHPYGLFAWISAGAGYLLALLRHPPLRRGFWPIIAAEALAFVLFTPWAYILLGVSKRIVEDGFWIDRPNVVSGAIRLVGLAGGPVLAALIGLLLVASVILWLRGRRPAARETLPAMVTLPILISATAGPVILGFAISQITTPIYLSRYLICILPSLLVLAGMAAGLFATTARRWAAIMFATIAAASLSIITDTRTRPEDWRSVAADIAATAQSSDCLITNGYGALALQFYLGALPACVAAADDAGTLKIVGTAEHVFVVLANFQGDRDSLLASLPGTWTPSVREYRGVQLTVLTRRAG